MSKSLKLPKEFQEASVTFVGFPENYSAIFAVLLWEMLAGLERASASGSGLEVPVGVSLRGPRKEALWDLHRFLESTLNFPMVALRSTRAYGPSSFSKDGKFSSSKRPDGFRVYPVSEPRRLRTMRTLGRLVGQTGAFLYEGVPREAQTMKFFPWGFRGLTEDGYRNFRWDRMAIKPSEPPSPATKIVLKSESRGGSGKITLWVDDGYENPHGLEGSTYFQETIYFKGKRIIAPAMTLLRRETRNPTGG